MPECSLAMSPHQIVKTISAGFSGAVQINPLKPLHNVGMIGDLPFRDNRLAVFCHFHVFTVVPADGYRLVNDIGDDQHTLPDFLRHLRLPALHFFQFTGNGSYPFFGLLRLILLSLTHQLADLFADGIALLSQFVAPSFGGAELSVQLYDFIHKRQFFLLEFLPYIFFDQLRIRPNQLDVQHFSLPFLTTLLSLNFISQWKRFLFPVRTVPAFSSLFRTGSYSSSFSFSSLNRF